MGPKSRVWLIVALAGVCAAVIGGVLWRRAAVVAPAALMARLPSAGALVLWVDFEQLRRAGILQLLDGPNVAEDPDYHSFVSQTGFDYKRHLDRAAVAFTSAGKLLLLDGSFDWKRLRAYAASQGGRCEGDLCRMQGSTPDRRISFFPLQSNLMALAVSQDDSAALRLKVAAGGPPAGTPDAPVWLSIPTDMLRSGESLPDGTRQFARTVGQAETVLLAFAPDGNRLAARLNVLCRNENDAGRIADQLRGITSLLRQMIARENQKPNPADLSGVLTAGSFRPEGRRVYGYWPIERAFVESILSGAH